jgi:hypothetical protein
VYRLVRPYIISDALQTSVKLIIYIYIYISNVMGLI